MMFLHVLRHHNSSPICPKAGTGKVVRPGGGFVLKGVGMLGGMEESIAKLRIWWFDTCELSTSVVE